MRYSLFFFPAIASTAAMATQMEGFGAWYYQDDPSIPAYDSQKVLTPDISLGEHIFVMEFSNLADIAKTAGVAVNQDDQASWLCLASEKTNYWFISDNEMGQGNLTAIAIARAEQPKGCFSYKGKINVDVKGVPLLDASPEKLLALFPNRSDGNTIQYCTDTKRDGDFTQVNCLQYYFVQNKVKGILLSQITTN